jgi:membrane protein implicated in regulation of membrane protease activity
MNLRVGPALVVIAIGAIFAFAVSATAIPGINLKIAGVIVLLVGIIALVLSLRGTSRFATFRTVNPWLRPQGHDDPRVDQLKRDAAADDAAIEQDDGYFDPSAPGNRQNKL